MESYQIGLYTVIILAASKVIFIALEIINARKLNARFLRASGYISALLALLLGCVSFVGLRAKGPDQPGQCKSADADIVGDGVRAASWAQVGLLFFITLTGVFHIYKTSVKEIGQGLIATHVSLAIALLVPLSRRELSPIDAILGSLILDAQGNSLSFQLVTKETLAARGQVVVALIAQLLGLIVEGILVGNFTANLRLTSDCDCFSAFWWSWLSNCSSVSPNDVKPFWIYFGYRFINTIYGGYFAITRTATFDEAEKWDRENPCYPCDSCIESSVEIRHADCKCHFCKECCYCKVCNRKRRCSDQKRNDSSSDEPLQGVSDGIPLHNINNGIPSRNVSDDRSNDNDTNNDDLNNDEALQNSSNSISSRRADDDGQLQNGNNDVPPQPGNNGILPHNGSRDIKQSLPPCKICEDCQRCHECGHMDFNAYQSVLLAGERFSEYGVTVSISFLETSVLALLSMISVEVTMNINAVQKTSPLYSVGQVTALVIAGGTALRVLYVFLLMFIV
ncbi:hypothetical protein F4813DRAFT_367778 [Daldinia decipiens]|uniref:uncharacterized protein n=1 Tax=Daldinia decipiens TaxID=326647 RepID=UPI0020C26E76|nr:uncharacterized protein F4813DRAFT_367778 [Daldinia decipiens]KAI1655405.1 hypothetical protein F4813DRAFT_367778 [Daldinia decipiens]